MIFNLQGNDEKKHQGSWNLPGSLVTRVKIKLESFSNPALPAQPFCSHYIQQKKSYKLNCNSLLIMLSCQGSNLDSSDPESDVLPITPQDSFLF